MQPFTDVHRMQPALVSEHLAWSFWNGAYLPDLRQWMSTLLHAGAFKRMSSTRPHPEDQEI